MSDPFPAHLADAIRDAHRRPPPDLGRRRQHRRRGAPAERLPGSPPETQTPAVLRDRPDLQKNTEPFR